jgi:iron complex outermembrane receptor protein
MRARATFAHGGEIAMIVWWAALLVSTFPGVTPSQATAREDADSQDEIATESGMTMWGMDTLVVTASRIEQRLDEAPAAMTVIGEKQLGQTPADDFGDLLRAVPGLNVMQASSWDISISSRNATNVLPQGQLVLVDGRSVFQDFNGTVWWNAVPLAPEEVKRIEVLRGPASAVWGANATDGVINIIPKSPREMVGTRVTVGAGELETRYARITHADARGRLGYKVSATWREQDPYDQPTGTIPGTDGPTNPGGTAYPTYDNPASRTPKLNLRVDFDQNDETTWSCSAGYAGIEGSILLPAGPADWAKDTFDAFGQVQWSRRDAHATFYSNFFESPDGVFLIGGERASIKTETYALDVSDSRTVGDRHRLAYGGSTSRSQYDMTLAPDAGDRDRIGAFLQDEIRITDHFRWLGGVRVDNIDPMGTAFSPRTTLFFVPVPGQTFRFSYNRAFLAPSAIESHVDFVNVTPITIPTPGGTLTLNFPLHVTTSPDLEETRLDAFEIGWVGRLTDHAEVSLAAYRNEMQGLARLVPTEFYSSSNPPPDWPLPLDLLDVPAPDGFAGIPSEISVTNVAELVNRGVEVSLDVRPSRELSLFLNYSWQDDPSISGIDPRPIPDGTTHHPINDPPKHRFNVGAAWDGGTFFANANVNYQDEAFWTDVLDERFWGPTKDITLVNVAGGVRLFDERMTVSVGAQNVFDSDAQQHVWGDFISRKVTGEATYRF